MAAPKGNKNAIGNKGGRPTDYKPEYCQLLIEWFEIEPNKEIEIPHYKDGDVTWTDYKIVANRLPKFHEFAKSIGTTHKTLLDWVEKNIEFSNAYIRAKELQKYFLIENGLNGCYNPTFTIFVSKNITDMKDTQQMDLTNNGNSFNTLSDAELVSRLNQLLTAGEKK
jgi:hypothetical protein